MCVNMDDKQNGRYSRCRLKQKEGRGKEDSRKGERKDRKGEGRERETVRDARGRQ